MLALRTTLLRAVVLALAAGLAVSCGGGGGGGSAPPSGGGSPGGGGSAGGGGTVTSTAPSAPTAVAGTGGDARVTISFAAPDSNGGAVVTMYTLTCSAPGGPELVSSSGSSPIMIAGLTNTVPYSCTVTATNAAGKTGVASAAVLVTPGNGTSSAPVITSAMPANRSAVISFSPPVITGSSPITSYSVVCVPTGTNPFPAPLPTRTATASPVLVLQLVNGVAHTCTVTASNASGSGLAATIAVTPAPSAATPAGVAAATILDFAATPSYALDLPAYFDATVAALDNTPAGQTPNDRIISLGRVMFYDRQMSALNNVSCSTCHQQAKGFEEDLEFPARFGPAFPPFGDFNTPGLTNVRYSAPGTMFWNRRAASLEAQAIEPLLNGFEAGWGMNGGIPALIAKMNSSAYYPDLFNFAFGSPGITQDRISDAIARFERAIVSTDSKWDQGYAQVFSASAPNRALDVDLPNFTASENRGRHLFMTSPQNGGIGCSSCHVPPTFTLAADARSNGLDGSGLLFKPPSLKNGNDITLGHLGNMWGFRAMVDHYDNGVLPVPLLDDRLRVSPGGPPRRLNLSEEDKRAVVDFLRTLRDTSLRADPRYSNPMVQ